MQTGENGKKIIEKMKLAENSQKVKWFQIIKIINRNNIKGKGNGIWF